MGPRVKDNDRLLKLREKLRVSVGEMMNKRRQKQPYKLNESISKFNSDLLKEMCSYKRKEEVVPKLGMKKKWEKLEELIERLRLAQASDKVTLGMHKMSLD
ncbi:hypothetical protein ACS0TY_025434 [Phlomoides rotata]